VFFFLLTIFVVLLLTGSAYAVDRLLWLSEEHQEETLSYIKNMVPGIAGGLIVLFLTQFEIGDISTGPELVGTILNALLHMFIFYMLLLLGGIGFVWAEKQLQEENARRPD